MKGLALAPPGMGCNMGVSTSLSNYLTAATCNTRFAPLNNPTFTGTVSGLTATMVGLGNVNNTSDVDKPISTATQIALTTAITNLINGAPVDLNTLEKLANAVAHDPDFAVHVTDLINTKQGKLTLSSPLSFAFSQCTVD